MSHKVVAYPGVIGFANHFGPNDGPPANASAPGQLACENQPINNTEHPTHGLLSPFVPSIMPLML